MLPALQVELIEVEVRMELEALRAQEYVIVLLRMEDVYPYLRYFLPMNVFMIVSIVLIDLLMM